MNKHTTITNSKSINEVEFRNVAKQFMCMPIEKTSCDAFVFHPFFVDPQIPVSDEVTLNLLDEDEAFLARCLCMQAFDNMDPDSIIRCINPPYLFPFLFHVSEFMDIESYSKWLRIAWRHQTILPVKAGVISSEQFAQMFQKADKRFLMSKKEQKAYKRLPETVTVFTIKYGQVKNVPYEIPWITSYKMINNIVKDLRKTYDDNSISIIKKEIPKDIIYALFINSDGSNVVIFDEGEPHRKHIISNVA